ncbi:hypothetical protein Aci022_113 [Acinetobacter phage vB_AbaM_B09_Aci02-2]|uniref:Uncharacterized protein n=1 Tax=Acinetobacter phage vB_AbaM_B09_Aci02-2 TaxID=2315467 RepID=A0A386KK60_9CAUD|nr:hypothetical protein HOU30_gp077 [Acinetobacter phage vB_AbaM_B09_Aci02-2]AYD85802.1 hypothetical protein Aci022_113 [Acinetobacter phage vB_AbaM_B09_Aci02-2]
MIVVSVENAHFINSVANWSIKHCVYDLDAIRAFQKRLREDIATAKLVNKTALNDGNEVMVAINDEDQLVVSQILKSFGERNGSNS